jgi:pimeloyl-ACP methyl ester carboxylesterase
MAIPWDWSAFREEQAELPTGTLTYHRAGEGPPLVVLHSAAGPRPSPVMFALAERHDVHMLTAPGFDGTARHVGVDDISSLAQMVAAFLERFGRPIDLMGESFGGWLALRVALQFPHLVDHLVLEGPAGLREGQPSHEIPRIFSREATAPEPGPHFMANRAAFGSYSGGRLDAELAGRLGEITARTLILMGTDEEVIPASTGQRLKDGIPHSHLTYVYAAGHGLEYDAPERVGPLIAKFLERGEGFLVRQAG